MITRRLVVCLDVRGGRVVKGVRFRDLRDLGNPAVLAARYEAEGADEVVFLDISASAEERAPLLALARETAERLFIPLTIGGGIRTAADVARALAGEADRPLSHCPSYSTAEVDWIIGHEHVRRLDDLVLRRTSLALLGEVTMPLLEELSHQLARHLGLSGPERVDAVAATAELLHQRYALDIREGQPA
jgi:glycerol-3-phosphate dehydrogenase